MLKLKLLKQKQEANAKRIAAQVEATKVEETVEEVTEEVVEAATEGAPAVEENNEETQA
jgi:small subunit ribosomal protein S16